jgi:hypothetical protein
MCNSHYEYLKKHLPAFFDAVGVRGGWEMNQGVIIAHGDKCYAYREFWERGGLHFYHGVSIYLLTYCHPFADEVRETKQSDNGWIDPKWWVLRSKDRFLRFLPALAPKCKVII